MILPYIINVALVLGACLAFYKILLRRETFYTMNRFLLVGCLAIAFALPLLTVPEKFSLRKTVQSRESLVGSGEKSSAMIKPSTIEQNQQPISTLRQAQGDNIQQSTSNYKPQTTNTASTTSNIKPQASNTESFEMAPAGLTADTYSSNTFSVSQFINLLFATYWFGVILFGATFLFQLFVLLYRSWRNPVIMDGKYRIVEITGDKAPCSFGNIIFINPSKYDLETFNQILLHEKIHVSQRHSIDILLAELVLIFQWFNPFAWIYRKEIESNLEFLTDNRVVQQKEIDKQSYQLSLLKVTAPHFPLSLTSNYNQSILKKRIAMMNTKRSNLHTAWKYFFLLPVLALLACLLNEPRAKGQTSKVKSETVKNETINIGSVQNEGYWFAIIKDDKVNIRFSDEKPENDDFEEGHLRKGHSYSGSTFKLSELGNIPGGTQGTFSITREAGTMEFTGKFDGNTGMGTYKFVANKDYIKYMNDQLADKLDDDEDPMAFFMVNIKKEYPKMLAGEGYPKMDKDDIIAAAALGIDAPFIKSMKSNLGNVSMEDLVPLKAMGIDQAYIQEIKNSGLKNIDAERVISFKAQGIDKDYIKKMKDLKGKDLDEDDADEMVSFKAMGIDEAYINSFKAAGLDDIPNDQLVSFKAIGVTPEYIRSWHNLGFKNIDPDEFVGMMSQGVTPEYMKSFTDMGFKNVSPEDLVAFKAVGVTPAYIKGWQNLGFTNIGFDEFVGMKSQGVTPEYMKSFTDMGFKNVSPEDLVAFKAVGVTPEYIKGWRDAGFTNIDFDEFVGMKSQGVTPEYMKSFTDMGFKNVQPDELVAFRALGITPEYIKSFEAAGYKNLDFDDLPALKSQNITPGIIKSFEELGFKNIDMEDIVSAKAMSVTPAYIKEMRAKGFNYTTLEKYVRLKSIDAP